jgi:hypothetical protein
MQTVKRIISAFGGALILGTTLVEGYFQSFGFYREHYVWPMEKFGVLTPLRWQDKAFLAGFWTLAVGLIYLSYRLLSYAGATRTRKTDGCDTP